MELLELILTLVILAWGLQILLFAVGLSKTPPGRALGWMLSMLIIGAFRLARALVEGLVVVARTTFRHFDLTWAGRIGRAHPTAELKLSPPPDQKISPARAEQFLLSLPRSIGPVSYEIIGTGRETFVQFACRSQDRHELRSLLKACFPDCAVAEGASLAAAWQDPQKATRRIVEYGLSGEFVLPVRTFTRSFDADPLIPVIGALEHLRPDEVGVFQIIFRQVSHRHVRRLIRAAADWGRGAASASARPSEAQDRKLRRPVHRKMSSPIYAVVIRIAARALSKERAAQITTRLSGALGQYADPTRNSFVPRSNIGYTIGARERDLLGRSASRGGILLNSHELSGLVHLPSASVRSKKLVRETRKTKAAPKIATGHALSSSAKIPMPGRRPS